MARRDALLRLHKSLMGRRDELRKELKSRISFLQPGETLTLNLRDGYANRDLGGQFCRIAQG